MALVLIDAEFEKLMLPLTAEEFSRLEINILGEGCRDPLYLWGNTLLDGHNRYKICKKHTLPFMTTQVDVETREEALLWIEEHQLGRRNLNDDQRATIVKSAAKRRAKLWAPLAAKKREDAKKEIPHDAVPCADNKAPKKGANCDATLSKEHRIPERKLRQAGKGVDKAPELAAKVRAGELTLAKAVREVEAREESKPFVRNPHRELLDRLRELNTPRFLDTIKALPPADNVKEQVFQESKAVRKLIDAIIERIER